MRITENTAPEYAYTLNLTATELVHLSDILGCVKKKDINRIGFSDMVQNNIHRTLIDLQIHIMEKL